MEDAPDTGRIELEHIAEHGTESERVFAASLAKLLDAHVEARGAEKERARWAWAWRAVGTLAFAIASVVAARAMSLAETAYQDHPRIERIEDAVEGIAARLDSTQADLIDRGIDLTARVERVDALAGRLDAIIDRLERTVVRIDERVTDLERERRR